MIKITKQSTFGRISEKLFIMKHWNLIIWNIKDIEKLLQNMIEYDLYVGL